MTILVEIVININPPNYDDCYNLVLIRILIMLTPKIHQTLASQIIFLGHQTLTPEIITLGHQILESLIIILGHQT